MTTRYQLQIDRKAAAPMRETIQEAALDALETGFATPDREGRVVLHDSAEIEMLEFAALRMN